MSSAAHPLSSADIDVSLAILGRDLLAQASRLALPAGAALFRAGTRPSRLYYVAQGEALMVRTTSAGAPVILQRAAQSFLAEASLTSERYHCDAICRVDSILLAFPIVAIRAAIDNNPGTRWAWIEMLAAQSRKQRLRIERLALRTVRERLEHLVLTEGGPDDAYVLPGTRMELAAELGVTHEALYRTLAGLQSGGMLRIEGPRLTWLGR